MKKVIFSFDDARWDTYDRAFHILKKYNFSFTVNVVTDFVLHQEKYKNFPSANNKSMTVEQIKDLQNQGVEIACHGHTHKNTKNDILDNINFLKKMDIDVENIGFASPNSEITESNSEDVKSLINDGKLLYIRSGIQVCREGVMYSFFTFLERMFRSSFLFYKLNKKNIICNLDDILMSVSITKRTTVNQIIYLINMMDDDETVILMFHSVLYKNDKGYGVDNWFYDGEKFEELCMKLSNDKNICVCTTRELIAAGEV